MSEIFKTLSWNGGNAAKSCFGTEPTTRYQGIDAVVAAHAGREGAEKVPLVELVGRHVRHQTLSIGLRRRESFLPPLTLEEVVVEV